MDPLKKRPRCWRNMEDLNNLYWADTFHELMILMLIIMSCGILLNMTLSHRTHGVLSPVFDKILTYANHPLNNWPPRENYPYDDLADMRPRVHYTPPPLNDDNDDDDWLYDDDD